MLKIKSDYFLNLIIIMIIIFFNNIKMVYGANENWFKVSKSNEGVQYLDKNSLNKKGKGLIEIKTKYLKFDANDSKRIEEDIYIMRINCLNQRFKDISVNGKKNLSAKWQGPNGDKLIIDVISDSCKNVQTY